MTIVPVVASVESLPLRPAAPLMSSVPALAPAAGSPSSFGQLLAAGVDSVNTKAVDADKLVRDFTLNESVPVHEVTYTLEQARLSMELMMQVRSRLLEGYQQLMNMQL